MPSLLTFPTSRRALRFLACALLAASAWSHAASARDGVISPQARAEARKLAQQGSDAFEAGQFEVALARFERAAAIVEAPTISLMQARTLVELGRLVAAAEHYAAAQRTDPADSGNAAFRNAAETAVRELEVLERRIPTLRVKLVGADARGASIVIDGRELAPEATAQDLLLDPGTHSVEVKTESGSSSSRTVTLVEGAREELVFSLEPVVRVPAPAQATAPALPEAPLEAPAERARKPRVGAWIALGSGAAFTGAGAVLGLLALDQKSELDRNCTPGCPADYGDEIHDFRLKRSLSYVGFALGAAGVGTSLFLFLRNQPDQTGAALAVSPTGITVSGRFQ